MPEKYHIANSVQNFFAKSTFMGSRRRVSRFGPVLGTLRFDTPHFYDYPMLAVLACEKHA
jgi:hypothetical protein